MHVLGTRQNALSSPQPYGLGVYKEDCDGGASIVQPLYYVSLAVAAARDHCVLAWWFFIAKPDTVFCLLLTKVKETVANEEKGALAEGDRVTAVKIVVDGHKCVSYRFEGDEKETCIHGFVETTKYDLGKMIGHTVIRHFRFQRACTLLEKVSDKNNTTVEKAEDRLGAIQLQIYSGPIVMEQGNPWDFRKSIVKAEPNQEKRL